MNPKLPSHSFSPVRWLLSSLLVLLPFLGWSQTIVISQVYGGGGNAGATYANDFIELHNVTGVAQSVQGFSVQYASATGTSYQVTNLSGSIPAGGYYLVHEAVGNNASAPSLVPEVSGNIAMATAAGKVALVSSQTALSGTNPTGNNILDFVGYGAANGSETAPTTAPSNTTAVIRTNSCTDTNNNSADFTSTAPAPRNKDTTPVSCVAPALTVSPATLQDFNALAGSASATQTYVLKGVNVNNSVTVSAPAGFEVAATPNGSTTMGAYTNSLTLTPAQVSGNGTTISVRLTAGAATSSTSTISGTVSNSSAGVTSKTIAVKGTIVGEPDALPTPSLTASTVNATSAVFTLSAGAGTNLLVVVRPRASSATPPTDGTTYSVNAIYGSGTALGSGFVVFADANATSITVAGLTASTNYTADVYSYNTGTAAGFENYQPAGGTLNFATVAPASSPAGTLAAELNFDYTGPTQLASPGVGWTATNSTDNNAVSAISGNLSREGYPKGTLSGYLANASIATLNSASRQVRLNAGATAQDVYREFSIQNGTSTLYAAALVSVDAAQTGDYFLSFYNSNQSPRTSLGRVYIRAATTSGKYNFGLSLNNGTPPVYGPTDYNLSATVPYLVVLKYEHSVNTGNLDEVRLYIIDNTDASSLAVPINEPTTPTVGPIRASSSANNFAGINAIYLQQGGAATGATLLLDNLRITNGWGTAVGRPVYRETNAVIAAGNYYSVGTTGNGLATLNGPVIVENSLNLDGGKINTTSTNSLTLRFNNNRFSFTINPNGNSFVDGPLTRESAGAPRLLFPIGRNAAYRPLTLNITQAVAEIATYTALQIEGPPNDQKKNLPLVRISNVRYYSITPSANVVSSTNPSTQFSGTVQLSFGPDDQVNKPEDDNLVVAEDINNGGWTTYGHNSNGTTSIESFPFRSFGNFILATSNPIVTDNPLPVVLTNFSAARGTTGVLVRWATASEANSDRFEVERSLDGKTFAKVASVAAHGSTAQANAYASLDGTAPAALLYYRLRQVDLDGSAHFSPVVTVAAGPGSTAELALYPNPARESISLFTEAATPYNVRNTLGQSVLSGTTDAGTTTVPVAKLPAGVYFFELHTSAGRVMRKFVKE